MTTTQTASASLNKGGMFYTIQFIRIFVGVLFIFSGLIKANDPSGLAYKMQEFFELWKMPQFSKFAFELSIAVITFEIMAGVALLLGYAFKFFSILLLILMLFFAYLTGYAIWYEHAKGVPLKCGCFGDCIPLTAMQSFLKDVLLLVLVVVLLIYKKHIRPLFGFKIDTVIMTAALIFSLGIQWWALEHLPFIDCLAYKKGSNLWEKKQVPPGAKPDVYSTTFVFEKEGKQIKVSQDDYMADSTLWEMTPIETKNVLIEKGNATPELADFEIRDYEGNDYTEALLTEPGYNFLWFVRDTDRATLKNIDNLKRLMAKALKGETIGFYILSSSSQEKTKAFLAKQAIPADVFTLDPTVSKTAVRSNPGLMLIKGGVVIGKWSYNDYPKDFKMNRTELQVIK